MAIPGSPAFLLPPGDDEIPRKLRDIERYITELGPSIAASIKPAMGDIRANVAALAAQDIVVAGLIADLAATQDDLATAQGTLADQVALLAAVADVQYAETTTGHDGFTGFYTGALPTVELSSPSGRIEVAYGGSLNGGEGYFCFSVTGATSGAIVTAAAVQANPARRVAVTGGASFAPSGHRSMVVTVPADEVMTVTLAYYAADTYVYFFGGSILARVTP